MWGKMKLEKCEISIVFCHEKFWFQKLVLYTLTHHLVFAIFEKVIKNTESCLHPSFLCQLWNGENWRAMTSYHLQPSDENNQNWRKCLHIDVSPIPNVFFSSKKSWKSPSKNFRILFWKLYISGNIGLRRTIYTPNES